MKRYFSSFFIAFSFYAFFAIGIFYTFANDKIIINKTEVPKTISLNHIELKPETEPVEEIKKEEPKVEEKKEEIKKEPIKKTVETPKPIIKKNIEKKEIETTKKVEEVENKPLEKIVTPQKEILSKPVIDEKKSI